MIVAYRIAGFIVSISIFIAGLWLLASTDIDDKSFNFTFNLGIIFTSSGIMGLFMVAAKQYILLFKGNSVEKGGDKQSAHASYNNTNNPSITDTRTIPVETYFYFKHITKRLKGEIEYLKKQANYNFLIGFVFAMMGVASFLFFPITNFDNIKEGIIIKASSFIALEVICLIFFNNYRRMNNLIKLYNGEISTIQLKEFSIRLLYESMAKDTRAPEIVIAALIFSERNKENVSEEDDKGMLKYFLEHIKSNN